MIAAEERNGTRVRSRTAKKTQQSRQHRISHCLFGLILAGHGRVSSDTIALPVRFHENGILHTILGRPKIPPSWRSGKTRHHPNEYEWQLGARCVRESRFFFGSGAIPRKSLVRPKTMSAKAPFLMVFWLRAARDGATGRGLCASRAGRRWRDRGTGGLIRWRFQGRSHQGGWTTIAESRGS